MFRAIIGEPGSLRAVAAIMLAKPDEELVRFVDTRRRFRSFDADPSSNNVGDVVFSVDLGFRGTGIFFGPHPRRDRLIIEGDELFGDVVTGLQVFYSAVNDRRQVVFFYELASGISGIARATLPLPVPRANGVNHNY